MARVTIGWGSLESRLFWMLHALEFRKPEKYIKAFFGPRQLARRKQFVLREIKDATRISYPAFGQFLEDRFDDLQSIQTRRNVIAHGIWMATDSADRFLVQPLGLKDDGSFEDIVAVDHDYLTTLFSDMDKLSGKLALLGAEMLAHQELKKRNPLHVSKNTFVKKT